MNEKLYDSLAKAQSVLEKKEEFEKRINENNAKIEQYEKQSTASKAEIEKLKSFGPDGRLRCGIIFTAIGSVFTVMITAACFSWSTEDILPGYLLALPPLVVGIILLSLYSKEKRRVKKRIVELNAFVDSIQNGDLKNEISQLRSETDKISAELDGYMRLNYDYVSFIPPEIQKSESVAYMAECLKEQLADKQETLFLLASMHNRVKELENVAETQKNILERLANCSMNENKNKDLNLKYSVGDAVLSTVVEGVFDSIL